MYVYSTPLFSEIINARLGDEMRYNDNIVTVVSQIQQYTVFNLIICHSDVISASSPLLHNSGENTSCSYAHLLPT